MEATILVPLRDYIDALLNCRTEAIIELELANRIQQINGWTELVAIEPTTVPTLMRMIKRSYYELCKNPVIKMSGQLDAGRQELIEHYIDRMLIMSGGKLPRKMFEDLATKMSTYDLKNFKEMNI